MPASLSDLRQLAARLTASSVLSMFPDVQLVKEGETLWGFYCDLFFPVDFQKDFLRGLEEQVKGLISMDLAVETIEMAPSNAASYFEHLGQSHLAKRAREWRGSLLEMVRIGSFVDFCPPLSVQTTGEIHYFKLLDFHQVEGRVRLFGTMCSNAQDLKRMSKKKNTIPKKDHIDWARELHLCRLEKEGVIWLPRGEALRERLIALWREAHQKETFEMIALPPSLLKEGWEERIKVLQKLSECERLAHFGWGEGRFQGGEEGMLDVEKGECDAALQFCGEGDLAQACRSSLHLILKILKMFEFEPIVKLYLNGLNPRGGPLVEALTLEGIEHRIEDKGTKYPRVEVLLSDGIGRLWQTSIVELRPLPFRKGEDKRHVVVHSLMRSLERMVAILIEKYQGKFPFWLAPEQIRLLVIGSQWAPFVKNVQEELIERHFRVTLKEVKVDQLAREVHEGCERKIPFVGLIGPRELESETIIVRAKGSSEQRKETLLTLIETLQQEEKL